MNIPEYCSIFNDTGEIKVEVRFKNFDGNVRNFNMKPCDIAKLIDPESGQFYSEMDFDEWRFYVYRYEIDPLRKKLIIRATGDLSYLDINVSKHIHWEQVETIFNDLTIWHEKPEMEWFQEAWVGIEKQGLADYKNEEEKQVVLTRAVTIAIMYHEYFHHAIDEYFYQDSQMEILFKHYKEVGFNFFQLGYIVGKQINPDSENDHDLFNELLLEIINKNRKQVARCLKSHFGTEESLVKSLWFSRYPGWFEIRDEDVPESTWNEMFKNRGYEYIFLDMPGIDF